MQNESQFLRNISSSRVHKESLMEPLRNRNRYAQSTWQLKSLNAHPYRPGTLGVFFVFARSLRSFIMSRSHSDTMLFVRFTVRRY